MFDASSLQHVEPLVEGLRRNLELARKKSSSVEAPRSLVMREQRSHDHHH
jgi:hypothetical protein